MGDVVAVGYRGGDGDAPALLVAGDGVHGHRLLHLGHIAQLEGAVVLLRIIAAAGQLAQALLPALPPMAEDRVASGVISSSSSFSRVTVLPSTASTLRAMLSPPSVTLETLVLLCSAAATFM